MYAQRLRGGATDFGKSASQSSFLCPTEIRDRAALESSSQAGTLAPNMNRLLLNFPRHKRSGHRTVSTISSVSVSCGSLSSFAKYSPAAGLAPARSGKYPEQACVAKGVIKGLNTLTSDCAVGVTALRLEMQSAVIFKLCEFKSVCNINTEPGFHITRTFPACGKLKRGIRTIERSTFRGIIDIGCSVTQATVVCEKENERHGGLPIARWLTTLICKRERRGEKIRKEKEYHCQRVRAHHSVVCMRAHLKSGHVVPSGR